MSNTWKNLNRILGWLLVATAALLVAGAASELYRSSTVYAGWEVDAGRAIAAVAALLAAAAGYLGYGRLRAARSPIRAREQLDRIRRR